jgi:hypothetical protein
MYTIKTKKSGKTFESDMIVESENPQRLYVGLPNTTPVEATVFLDPEEIEIEGHEDYNGFCSMNTTPTGGVIICLMKGGAA